MLRDIGTERHLSEHDMQGQGQAGSIEAVME